MCREVYDKLSNEIVRKRPKADIDKFNCFNPTINLVNSNDASRKDC